MGSAARQAQLWLTAAAVAVAALVVGSEQAQALTLNPSFQILSISSTVPGADAEITLETTVPAGSDPLKDIIFFAPSGWKIANDGQVPDNDVTVTGTGTADVGCDMTIDTLPAWTFRDATSGLGVNSEWLATDTPWQLRFSVDGSQNVGFEISSFVANTTMPTPMCAPQTFTFTFKAKSDPSLSPVMTNPNAEGSYEWIAIYAGLTDPITAVRKDAVAIGADADFDSVPDSLDNCPNVPNGPDQAGIPGVGNQDDTDGDGFGDACDQDDDNDGFNDFVEGTIGTDPRNPCDWPANIDLGGTLVDSFDVFYVAGRFGAIDGIDPLYTVRAEVSSQNGVIDDDPFAEAGFFGVEKPECADDDGDGVPNTLDNCPAVPNGPGEAGIPGVGNQDDIDGDGLGDACDPDSDNDGWTDVQETFIGTDPFVPCLFDGWPPDIDSDGRVFGADVFFASSRLGTFPPNPAYTPRAEITSQDSFIGTDDVDGFSNLLSQNCFGLIF